MRLFANLFGLPPLPVYYRLLCPYPKVGKIINPNGNIWDASNFVCKRSGIDDDQQGNEDDNNQ